MTKTVIFVGSVSNGILDYFVECGYSVGLFQEKQAFLRVGESSDGERNPQLDFIIPIDFSSRKSIENSVKNFYYKPDTLLFCSKDRYILPHAYLAHALNLNQRNLLPLDMVRQATSKLLQRKQFEKTHSEITPKFKKVRTFHSAYMFARRHGFPLITKPSSLSQSQLVNKANNLEELIKVVSYSLDHISDTYQRNKIHRAPTLLIEEFVPGKLYSVDSYVSTEGEIFHTKPCREFTGGEFGFPDASIPVSAYLEDYTKSDERTIYDTVSKAIQSLNIRGNVVHTEVKIMDSGDCQVIELNLRGGGRRADMLRESYNIDHNQNIIAAILNQRIETKNKLKKYSAYLKLSPKKVGVLKDIEGLNTMENSPMCLHLNILAQPGYNVGPLNHGFPFTVTALYSSSDKKDLLKEVKHAMDTIKFHVDETELGEESDF
jgi:hypothetical protein